ncbi:MAG: hypothetical protein C0505_15955 [Leptothrix sp. (in: Bacteria)]|nr:hypothetical protein [Leptothrix sp. (in: b-proteobacteria)]
MNAAGADILASLQSVVAQRLRRRADPELGRCARVVKAYQHARFMNTYADMLADPRYGGAALFFLEDLYGPGDFTSRDDQFARIVPGLVRMFPKNIVDTVQDLGRLHALSEGLDTAMAEALRKLMAGRGDSGPESCAIDRASYGQCWRAVAGPADRERQISLMLAVGEALEAYTRNSLVRASLRLMRGPAQAAGLGALQAFLERGFDTFRAMHGAGEFLSTIARRERALAAALFAGADAPDLPDVVVR